MDKLERLPPLSPELRKQRILLMAELSRLGTSADTISAMTQVRRDLLVPDELRTHSYDDTSLKLSEGQTISQPRIVATMTDAMELDSTSRVLDVGTGSGYQAAIAACLSDSVVTVERIDALRIQAEIVLNTMRLTNIMFLSAGEVLGAPEHAPFDAIVVAAAAPSVPRSLIAQLAPGGRMVIPVGDIRSQMLTLIRRTATGTESTDLGLCQFVPLIGPEAWDT
ncbi:MAG: protein-L-isoaspartate(D-aspartate) O-methyltransferase [Chloroflexi bacterium]|nr:protein-L-isoaspartate(D-aspartate) O-methyltransferase [Chloroflexota bacterium]